jgi:serine/threonine protein kinase
VSLFGACTQEPNLAFVMELMEGGSLSDLLHSKEIDLSWPVRLTMAEEIAKGIQVLHTNKPQVTQPLR